MSTIKRAAALGFFDGVHIGHAALMQRVLEVCRDTDLTPAVLTFDVLPQIVLKGKQIQLINSSADRLDLIRRLLGIDDIIMLNFDSEMAAMSWEDFVDLVTVRYGIRHFVIGRNFKFGRGARGDHIRLKDKCNTNGWGCDVITDVVCEGRVSSSSYIRSLLTGGEIERANAFLGHPHVLTAKVHTGQRLGTKFGTPTINMSLPPDVLVPVRGVYATKVFIVDDGSHLPPIPEADGGLIGVTNIGVRPTVDKSGLVVVETHIPGFSRNLYSRTVRIEFHSFIREEIKFGGVDGLKGQIKRDSEAVLKYFDEKTG